MEKLFILSIFVLSACTPSRVWVVSQGNQEAVLGYQLGNNETAQADLDKKLELSATEICGDQVKWEKSEVVDKVEVRSDSFDTRIADTTSYSDQDIDYSAGTWGADYASPFLMVHDHHSYTYEDKWREMKIKCLVSH